CLRKGRWEKNGMWTINTSIADVISDREEDLPACSLVAHIPNFERFYFGEELSKDKPYHAMTMMASPDFQKTDKYDLLKNFVVSALEGNHPGCYTDYKELTGIVKTWRDKEKPLPVEAWELERHE
ncbi:unnamed protein product, partial [marine sediment metagenome]